MLFLIMDDFVSNKLTEWNLSEWIQTFKDQGVDKESLYCLEDQEIVALIPKVGPRSKFKNGLKLLKEEQNTTDPETSESSVEVCPSTSKTNDKGKRKLDLQGEFSQSPASKRPREDIQGTKAEEVILSDVKKIMRCVHQKLPDQDDKLNKFLKNNINDLETDKGRWSASLVNGAGKSSLINAIIGVKDLLPSGDISACTSVMIKVEANMRNPKYEAKIEFITKEAKELSAKLVKYTRSESNEEDAKDVKRWYWPLVKCVTVRVPKNRLLQHVTLGSSWKRGP
ncbi:hypothetical protein F7725_003440 [Dissostichus mawsoni]|uniref:SAM domain-containing protein n=1 Tax=Dissostichus mawsoni TaxID=36200 RepID=A0A7J5YA91_DISMA|nr:hypothetical protein F7725_003440 [Dissostichus mawsoni]